MDWNNISQFPHQKKIYFGFNFDLSSWSVCRHSFPGQELSDHDIVSGTLKIAIPPIKKPRRKVYRYHKGDYGSMNAETLKFAKERYFNGYSDHIYGILVRSKKISISLLLLFRNRQINIFPQKLVAQFSLSLG